MVKDLMIPSIDRLSTELQRIDCGTFFISGKIEVFSCKTAGSDKALFRSLDGIYVAPVGTTPPSPEPSSSPFGSLENTAHRRTFYYLIASLNLGFPDYHFDNVRPEQFVREPSLWKAQHRIDSLVSGAIPDYESSFKGRLWAILGQELNLPNCDIFTLEPEGEMGDPFADESGSLWSQNYFFYNKTLKRIGFIILRAISKSAENVVDGPLRDDSDSYEDAVYEYGFQDEMEL